MLPEQFIHPNAFFPGILRTIDRRAKSLYHNIVPVIRMVPNKFKVLIFLEHLVQKKQKILVSLNPSISNSS